MRYAVACSQEISAGMWSINRPEQRRIVAFAPEMKTERSLWFPQMYWTSNLVIHWSYAPCQLGTKSTGYSIEFSIVCRTQPLEMRGSSVPLDTEKDTLALPYRIQ
jgi:hypothetical protein